MESKETIRAAKVLLVAGGIMILGIVVGFILAGSWTGSPVVHAKDASSSVVSLESPFTQIADRVLPAVVTIETKRSVKAGEVPGFNFEGPYGDFFKRLFPETPKGTMPHPDMKVPSSGSGFIFDKDGRILTNNHVIKDAADITVILSDKRKFKAKVVGADPSTDVAVIQIKSNGNLPTVSIGDSDEIRIGDWAIAIGNALGELDGTLTVGVISAKGRSNLMIAGGAPAYQNFIQTDASINFGNSGGPLLNIRGEAIGINTAINPSGEGIGFAIPINIAKHISEQLVANGRVVRGWLGIQPQELTPELAESWGLRDVKGILVANVSDGTPADSAGFHVKDVITEFDGRTTDDVQKFRLLVADTPVNKRVRVHLLRSGQGKDIWVKLGERPDEKALARQNAPPAELLGITVESTAGDFAREKGIREKSGVIVADVVQGSPADDAGVESGDIIKEVNDESVKDVFEYNAAVNKGKAKNPGKPIVFLIKRGDATQFVAVDTE